MHRFVFTFLLVTMISGCQRQFIYYPATASEARLMPEAEGSGMRAWRGPDNELIGWRPVSSGAERRMLVFHGNAGYALHRSYYVEALSGLDESFEVFILEYPGYGARSGRPSEEKNYTAAEEALRLLFQEDERPVFLTGESLGSGVASEMAARFPDQVEGLLLVTPFTTLREAGRAHFPAFLLNLILTEEYDNVQALKSYRGPLAVLLAEHDEVVPARLGRELYDTYGGPKKIWIQRGRTHNTLNLSPSAAWWEEVVEFLVESRSKPL